MKCIIIKQTLSRRVSCRILQTIYNAGQLKSWSILKIVILTGSIPFEWEFRYFLNTKLEEQSLLHIYIFERWSMHACLERIVLRSFISVMLSTLFSLMHACMGVNYLSILKVNENYIAITVYFVSCQMH
jgi:hypothetical protein